MNVNMRSPHPPKMPPGAGMQWACHAVRPATGRPTNPDGTLQLVWEYVAEAKPGRTAPDPEAPQPKVRRGFVQLETPQPDLFATADPAPRQRKK